MKRREFLATGAATLGTAIAGCASGDGLGYDIAMVSNAFVPGTTSHVPEDAPEWVPREDPTLEIRVGETVVWENTDSRIHTVTAATVDHEAAEAMLGTVEGDEGHHETGPRLPAAGTFFASGDFTDELTAVESFFENVSGGGAIPPGKQYAHTFHTPGWYHYYCIPHETAGMMGNVHVLDV